MNCPNCKQPYNMGDELCPHCGYVFPLSTDILSPSTVLRERYEIEELAHSGGMGYVYYARDKTLYDRPCIVKQVKERVGTDKELLKKLQAEAKNMAKLMHPNVANILDHFVENDYYFIVVERIWGKTLSEIFADRKGQLSEDEVLDWAVTMSDVVNYMHREGVLHRDISPDNVMLTNEGTIKFIDFGTMRELKNIASRGTAGMGKFGYTPPEQWVGRPVPQSDVFALGATIYYLLAGYLPLSREYLTGEGVQGQDFSPEFPPIRNKNTLISTELEGILNKALQLGVNSRYHSAEEFSQALRDIFEGKIKEKPVLQIDRENIEFSNVKPGNIVRKDITIKNVGIGKLTGKIVTTQPWLKLSHSTVELEKGEKKIKVTVDTTGIAPEYYGAGEINFTTNGGRATITITLSTTPVPKRTGITLPGWFSQKKRLLIVLVILILLVPAIVVGINSLSRTAPPAQPAPSPPTVPKPVPAPETVPAPASPPGGDGKIAFTSNRDGNEEIYVMDTDGSNQTRLTNNNAYDGEPAWSPDNRKIAFRSNRNGNQEIYLMNTDGGNQTNLSRNSADDAYPAWSPDGTKIAFRSNRDGNWEIYVMDADGGNQRNLSHNSANDAYPTWSPDGTRIAFRSNRDGNYEIYVMNADGSNQTNLSRNSADDAYPAWSPDGTRIAFRSNRDGNYEIYTMNANGSRQTNLSRNSAARDNFPTWSPNNKQIAFMSDRDGNSEIYVMNANGSNQINLSQNSAHDAEPAWSSKGTIIASPPAGQKPFIHLLTADPGNIDPGGFSMLQWNVSNANFVAYIMGVCTYPGSFL